MYKIKSHYKTDEIENEIIRHWQNIDNNLIRKLILSFKKRLEMTIRVGGNITKY